MPELDRKTYDNSTVDWDALQQLAKRAAAETLEAPNANGYWVLAQRFCHKTIHRPGYLVDNEEHDYSYYCLRIDGELLWRLECEELIFYLEGRLARRKEGLYTEDSLIRNPKVEVLDFKERYYEHNDGEVHIWRDDLPSDELQYPTKGACLTAYLLTLLNRSAERYKNQAIQGDVAVQLRLGDFYYNAERPMYDPVQAFEWYILAAIQGNVRAQTMLGHGYFYGKGMVQDYSTAVEWYTRSAISGDQEAQVALGRCYQQGLGIEADNSLAIEWYQKAANQGNACARDELNKIQLLEKEREKHTKKVEANTLPAPPSAVQKKYPSPNLPQSSLPQQTASKQGPLRLDIQGHNYVSGLVSGLAFGALFGFYYFTFGAMDFSNGNIALTFDQWLDYIRNSAFVGAIFGIAVCAILNQELEETIRSRCQTRSDCHKLMAIGKPRNFGSWPEKLFLSVIGCFFYCGIWAVAVSVALFLILPYYPTIVNDEFQSLLMQIGFFLIEAKVVWNLISTYRTNRIISNAANAYQKI